MLERVRIVGGTARLVGARCARCGHTTFPRRRGCPACGSDAMEEANLGPDGMVDSCVTLFVSTEESEAPYAVGLVRLEEGPTLLTRIVGAERAGMRVRLETDPDRSAFWFAPAEETNAAPPHAA